MMGTVVVTGGAGFIGSNLVNHLVRNDYDVIIIDNLSSGREEFIKDALNSGKAKLIKLDLKKVPPNELSRILSGAKTVYHLAANPEVRVSVTNPKIHFDENVVATFNVIEACRLGDVGELVFTSSSTVYGDAKVFPTPEDYQPLIPISVYGAAKLACEYLIITYSVLYGIKSLILRLANIVGPNQSHGVIVDFIRKLKNNPNVLEILGDGTQRKSYLYMSDLLSAMDITLKHLRQSSSSFEVYNVGNKDWITVKEIADIVVNEMGLKNVKYVYKPATKDGRGWKGDVKFMLLDIKKLMKIGWSPKCTSAEAIRLTVRNLLGKKP